MARAPEELGPYLVLDRIGVGGMAVVDRAVERGLEGLERIVALKRLLPHLASDESEVRSFVREARLASLLQHANIVHIYTLGRVGTDYFIAMEYVEGCSLRKVLRWAHLHGPPPIPVAIAIVRQVCDALDHAHRQRDIEGHPLGLVHRDVSPGNLLVSRSGHVKVIDFGIAQSIKLRTEPGRIQGKLPYMSPEAIAGEPLDHRSDLFSLGVVFHELLTARSLFGAAIEFGDDRRTIPPPARLRDDVPPEVDAIVMRALATDPAARWSSAAELRAALLEVCPMVATPSGIAAWCEPAFTADDSGPIALVDEGFTGDAGSSGGIVLDDVPDYAEYSVGERTTVGLAPSRPGEAPIPTTPSPSKKWIRAGTIETHTVPPPPRASTPLPGRDSSPPGSLAEAGRSRPAVSQPPGNAPAAGTRAASPRLPRRARRIDPRIAIAVGIGVSAIGIALLIAPRGSGERPATDPAGAASAPAGGSVAPAPPPAPPTTAAITIEDAPAGATIVVGAMAPHAGSRWQLELAAGSYPIAIRAPGFEPWQSELVVRAGEAQRVRAGLTPAPTPVAAASGTLAIDSVPAGLEVILDGAPLSNRTPIRMGIVPGAHKLAVRDAAGEVWSTEFVAAENRSHRFVAARPVPAPAPAAVAPVAATADAATEAPPDAM